MIKLNKVAAAACIAVHFVFCIPAYAETEHDPILSGYYDNRLEQPETRLTHYIWARQMLDKMDCSETDRIRISKNDILGANLKDLCNYSEGARRVILMSAKKHLNDRESALAAEYKRYQGSPSMQRRPRAYGMLLSESEMASLRQQAYTEVRAPVKLRGENVNFYIALPHVGPPKIYVRSIDRKFCAEKENTLESDSTFMKAMIAKYGNPSSSIGESYSQLEAQLAQLRLLINLKEETEFTDEAKKEIRLYKQKQKEFEKMIEIAKNISSGVIKGYEWLYHDHAVTLKADKCEDGRPQYTIALVPYGGVAFLFGEIDQKNEKDVAAAVKKYSDEKKANAPVPSL